MAPPKRYSQFGRCFMHILELVQYCDVLYDRYDTHIALKWLAGETRTSCAGCVNRSD